MERREFLTAGAGLALALAGASCSLRERAAKQRPNILFIFSDDHAVQSIGACGSVINTTPNIDRLAGEGVTFDRCFCANSICAPSRASILTGKHSHANGKKTNGDTFDIGQTLFPALMQQAGYATALIGKWHLRAEPRGFDHWEILPGQGSYYNPDFMTAEGTVRREGYVTEIITDRSLDWLRNRPGPERPFLLMCQHKAPHRVWAPGPGQLDLYREGEIPEPETLFDTWDDRVEMLKENEMTIARHLMYDYDLKVPGLNRPDALGRDFKNPEYARMTPAQRDRWDAAYKQENDAFRSMNLSGKALVRWKYQRYIKDYLRCVAAVDESVGRLLDYLDETGLAGNTIVVYSSDQGFYLGEHGWYDKRWMYEESFRMPFLIRWPGHAAAGTRTAALSQNIDFAPTFLDAAGIRIPGEMQGMSLLPLLRGRTPGGWRDALYYHYYEKGEHNVPPHEGARDRRYKLIHYYEQDLWELFDLETDPRELHNRYRDPAYGDIAARMHTTLDRLKKQYAVPEE
ncbi:sulfatase [bacterium]|nr:sulfatase [bacterium]